MLSNIDEIKPKLPSNWKIVRLGDVLDYEQPAKYIVKSEKYDKKHGIPVLTPGKSFILGYTEENFGVYKDLPVILFDDFTTESKYVSFKFKVKSSAVKILKLKDPLNNLYFLFCLLQIIKIKPGSEHKRFWISEYSKLKIPLPPPNEQRKIAEILKTVDNVIEKTENIIKKYKMLKRGLMQELFVNGIDEKWQIRSKKNHKFKDSELGKIPEKWIIVRLGELSNIISGSTPKTNISSYWGGEINWFTPDDLSKSDSLFLYESKRKITYEGLASSSAKLIPAYSIIVSSRAPIGYIKIPVVNFATNQGCKSIKKNEKFDSVFLANLLKTKINEMINLGGGTTFQEISKSNLASLKIPFPPLLEQQRISLVLSQIDKVIDMEKAYKNKLEKIKKGLIEDLLTGKVRVNCLNKEIANGKNVPTT